MKLKSFNKFINENFSNFFKNINLDKLKEEIEKWCEEMNIKNYELVESENYSYIINVNGDVNLAKKNLTRIPYKFGIVNGNFMIFVNNLETLENSPDECKIFNCSSNPNLKSLIGGPKKTIIYRCKNCNLESLEGSPEKSIEFNCSNNLNLKTLINGPQKIEYYHCNNCDLRSLEGAPKKCKLFNCSDNPNLKTLIGGPKIVESYYCKNCNLKSLEGVPQKCKLFNCSGNPGKFTEDDVRQYIKEIKEIIV